VPGSADAPAGSRPSAAASDQMYAATEEGIVAEMEVDEGEADMEE
jgi:hypothetical protein